VEDIVTCFLEHSVLAFCHWNLYLIVVSEFILHNSVIEFARCRFSQNPNEKKPNNNIDDANTVK